MISAVVVAAGNSRRMLGTDKLWLLLNGKPVAQHCLETFQHFNEIGEVILVVREDSYRPFEDMIQRIGLSKVKKIVSGGKERQFSVWNGLQQTSAESDLILIHDAARPLVTPRTIQAVAAAAREMGAAVCGTPVTDTLKEVDKHQVVVRTPPRHHLMAVQTPQIFQKELIYRAYEELIQSNRLVTDDTTAVENIKQPVRIVVCDDPNPKITTALDLPWAELILKTRSP